jgi:L-lactate dehydrogenase complex protein LldF
LTGLGPPFIKTLATGTAFNETMSRELGSAAAIRAATHRALAARERLLQGYPRWQEWRHQARAIKAEAIHCLDELLAQLERRVTAWGGRVLWARDAGEARRLILEVARQHQVQAVVKSKSMTAEEIGLTPYLSAAGIRVTETDLGEFIVQLAGHRPAHLTAPALHLDRHQIARLLADRLGFSCPPEPEALCRQASQYLKGRYPGAQMGITGVNFASAADGTLVFLENESNLCLTASRPPVHLALMGIEKVIPDLHGLEVFLPLLPASATGQRLTALVHFLKGLKTGLKGSQAFYLVLLDNGRRSLAADPELAEALYCLRCGACLNICPVFQVGGAHLYGRVYPGAIGILLAPYLAPVGDISDLCSQCGACADLCPVAINLPDSIRHIRQRGPRFRRLRALSRMAGLVLSRPRLYRQLEPGLRFLPRLLPAAQGGTFLKASLSPESFHQRRRKLGGSSGFGGGGQGSQTPAPSAKTHPPTPYRGLAGEFEGRAGERRSPGPSLKLLETRLKEVGGLFHRVRGLAALARGLAARAGEPLWLEDHPWLRQLAPRLEKLALAPHFLGCGEGPGAAVDTMVTVGLAAIPETGTVITRPLMGQTDRLPSQVRRQIVLIPRDRATLSLAQALELTRQGAAFTTWLTGPSRTADIEKVMVLGAQGPGELEVVLYQESGAR